MSDTRSKIEELDSLTVGQLRQRYDALFGEPSRSSNRRHLLRRLAWRIQAEAEGGLSERARRRARELADDARLRLSAPKEGPGAPNEAPRRNGHGDRVRALSPGTVLVRRYKDRVIEVTVEEDGYLLQGESYRSLSAVARAVTGSRWSGNVFFGLRPRRRR